MRQLGEHGREVAVDIVEKHKVGAEIVQQAVETLHHVAAAEDAPRGTKLGADRAGKLHLRRKIPLPRRRIVFRKLHGEDRRFASVAGEKFLRRHTHHTVAAARVIEFIDNEYLVFHDRFQSAESTMPLLKT